MNPQIAQIAQINTNEWRDPKTFAVIGAAMEVHRHLGCGFLEAVYQDALAFEFAARGVPFEREVEMAVSYKGRRLNTGYSADFVCFDSVIVELKALARLSENEEAKIIHDLKSTHHDTGLLLNFGASSLEYRRFVFSDSAESVKPMDFGLRKVCI